MNQSIEQQAAHYYEFCKNVKAHIKLLQLIDYHAVRPTWVSDDMPYLAYIDGVKKGEPVRLRAQCGPDGVVSFQKESV